MLSFLNVFSKQDGEGIQELLNMMQSTNQFLKYASKQNIFLPSLPNTIQDTEDFLHETPILNSAKICKKKTDWDAPPSIPKSQLQAFRRESYVTEQNLASRRQQQLQHEHCLKEQKQNIDKKQIDFRGFTIQYDIFIKENKDKYDRAKKNLYTTQMIFKKKSESIERMISEIKKLEHIEIKLLKCIEDHKMYQDFLDKSKGILKCNNISDILNRYETLHKTRDELTEKRNHLLETMAREKTDLIAVKKRTTTSIIGLNKEHLIQHNYLDSAMLNTSTWERSVEMIKEKGCKIRLEINQVKNAAWILYKQVCEQMSVPVALTEDNLEQQLLTIKHFLLQMATIVYIAQKRAKSYIESKQIKII